MAVELYDEHEQGERVRQWIKEYSSAIIVGLILAFAGIFGFRQWQDHRAGQQVLAAEYYQIIQSELDTQGLEAAAQQYQAMVEAAGSAAYTGLAALHLAAAHVENDQLEAAAKLYREVRDNQRLKALHPVATLRLARVLEAQGDIEAALALLDGAAPSGFGSAWAETRGDLLFERGRVDEARQAWEAALAEPGTGGNRRLLEVKIDAAAATGSRADAS
ncbi:MAG: tetratricopeptide repeat protein [Pseudomonadota bacterium]|nr:MAG: tetratricopeptide repeat protein [Pseudomonadota bacterium]